MRSRLQGCLVALLVAMLLGSVVLNLTLATAWLGGTKGAGRVKPGLTFEEEFVSGEKGAPARIVIIDLVGIITSAEDGAFDGSMVDALTEQLKQAREDSDIKAILLRINSPGGEVVASDAIYHEIQKTDAVKPVVVYMETVAASGGYYAAIGGRYLMANPLSLTGSIGVILQTLNIKELSEKIGIRAVTFKSGENKDLLNAFRDMTPEERAIVQEIIDQTYDRFVTLVAEERDLNVDELRATVADGRVLSGTQALEAKLIDGVGYFEDAVAKAKDLAKVSKAEVVRYVLPFNFKNLFRILGQEDNARIEINLHPSPLALQPGRLYYLSTHLFSSE